MQLPGDCGKIIEHPVGELFFLEFIPHMLLRIVLWGIRG